VRKSLEETWQYLEAKGETMPRDPSGCPFIPTAVPNDYDEELGYSFFRTRLEDYDLSHLSLPRTFFGRSELGRVSFAGTDLSESRMCWNDFVGCDFYRTDLSRCDMRASKFEQCRFVGASLRGADLRRSSFEGCEFSGADLTGAIAEKNYGMGRLTDEQKSGIIWAEDQDRSRQVGEQSRAESGAAADCGNGN